MRQVKEALRAARLAGGEVVTDDEEEGHGDENNDDDDDEWGGIEDAAPAVPAFVDHEEEYVDEDKYTTVTVEAVDIDRDGMHALSGRHTSDSEAASEDGGEADADEKTTKTTKTTKTAKNNGHGQADDGTERKREKERPTKKKKFRYESKIERALSKPGRKRR